MMNFTTIKHALNLYEQKERERRHLERQEEERRIREKYDKMKKHHKGHKKKGQHPASPTASNKETAKQQQMSTDEEKEQGVEKTKEVVQMKADEEPEMANQTAEVEETKSKDGVAAGAGEGEGGGDKTAPEGGAEEEDGGGAGGKELTLDQQMELEIKALMETIPEPNYREDAHIKMWGMIPPISKMDNNLALIAPNCERLSLSTNQIEKIQNITSFKKLKSINLSRNNLKNLMGLEAVGDTLEELFCSYNLIEKLKPVVNLKKLRKLFLSCNLVRDWNEVVKLAELHELVELNMFGNVLVQRMEEEGIWRKHVRQLMKHLRKLDNLVLFE
ncbi:uncharacterized protein LOC142339996 isoform X2 [Convolutriloba macropyga]|uniref:uncharacterized protein LOC142339996 isoform X2 n=1 Tax=Convolutriloba macropyga TaxID=536237 RepID=UPI003F526EC6